MNKSRDELISELTEDLTATKRAGRVMDLILLWLAFNFVITFSLIFVTGPFRDGSLQQAFDNPLFLMETVTGLAAIMLLSVTSFRSAIPANIVRLKQFLPALFLLSVWFGFYVFGLWSPALESSVHGEREIACYIEVMLYGLPSLLFGLYIIDRLWILKGEWTGLMIGLASGATPALIMQFACMYVPSHNIIFHLFPGLVLGVAGFIAGKYFLSR